MSLFRRISRLQKTRLDSLGKAYGTDKSSGFHDYLNFYESRLGYLRDEEFLLIEIGVLKGASIRMWAELFPRARILGIDYDPAAERIQGGNISIAIGNAGDRQFLQDVLRTYGGPRVVIDDVSHRWDHQILALHTLFPALVPGGHFIVEDIDTSFEAHLAKAPFQGESNISTFDYVYRLARVVVGEAALGSEQPLDSFIAQHARNTSSIEFIRRSVLINKSAAA